MWSEKATVPLSLRSIPIPRSGKTIILPLERIYAAPPLLPIQPPGSKTNEETLSEEEDKRTDATEQRKAVN